MKSSQSGIPKFPPILAADYTTIIPYTQEQMLNNTATFTRQKNYHNTACNIYHAMYDTLNTHINNVFKVTPSTTPPTIGWSASMLLNNIFDQVMKTYGRPTPDAVHQNMKTFLSPYSPQDPPEKFFKQCADCQDVAITANVKFTNEQLLMNIIDLLTRCSLYQ
jgi:hypothetical protein